MKKLILALPVLFALACGNTEDAAQKKSETTVTTESNKEANHDHEGHNHEGHDHEGHDHGEKVAEVVSYKTHDPVCKMTRDEKWDVISVLDNGDTVKFCADRCKAEFDKNPEKYTAKK